MNDKILLQLMDIFRGEPLSDHGALASLMFIAWHQVSLNPVCPAHLQMKNCQGISAEDLVKAMDELSTALQDPAFAIEDAGISRMKPPTISAAINWCLNMGEAGLLAQYDPTDAVLSFNERELSFPEEICDLLVGLAGNIANQTIYLPWESNGQLTGRILKKKAAGKVETKWRTSIPALVSSILSGGKLIQIAHNDPLRNPHYVEGGRLKTFGTTLALLPFGVNVPPETVDQDLFDRFKEKTRSMTVLAVRHILAQTQGRAIITTMNALLFSSGAERSLREDLLNRQQIEAVVAMPAGLLGMTAIPFTILILNTEKPCETVRFVNADTPRFKEAVSRTKSRLINLDELVETVLGKSDNDIVKNVSTQDILANDAQLQVSRYVLGAAEQKVSSLLASMPIRRLHDMATLVKPVANVTTENGMAVYEVGASDLPDYGYIHTASKQILVEPKPDKMKDQFLRPGDIVLIIKGNLGKVGIVGHAPPPGESGWIAGQSAAVIRLEKASGIDPIALFMLLRSEFGKGLVKTLASGSAIPFVQLRELKQLGIPVPSRQESDKAITALIEEEALQHQINELQQRQALLSAGCWSLNNEAKSGHGTPVRESTMEIERNKGN